MYSRETSVMDAQQFIATSHSRGQASQRHLTDVSETEVYDKSITASGNLLLVPLSKLKIQVSLDAVMAKPQLFNAGCVSSNFVIP